jgi:hypothetical protein
VGQDVQGSGKASSYQTTVKEEEVECMSKEKTPPKAGVLKEESSRPCKVIGEMRLCVRLKTIVFPHGRMS